MVPRPPLDELLSLFRATVAREGTTTSAGAATGKSIIDSALIGIGANSFINMRAVVYPGDFQKVAALDIATFNTTTGEITFYRAYKNVAAAIPAGVPYKIVTFQTSYVREAGKTQISRKQITSAANAGDVTVATISTQPCLIKSIVLRANAAITADLTSAAIYGGAGKVVTFIDAASGARANIAATDKQVFWVGAVAFGTGKTIVITLTGTGATAVNFQVTIEYEAAEDGGYLS